jgi:hypothetical protein
MCGCGCDLVLAIVAERRAAAASADAVAGQEPQDTVAPDQCRRGGFAALRNLVAAALTRLEARLVAGGRRRPA